MSTDDQPSPPVPVLLRQDFVGGLIIIAVAAFAFWQGADLPMGSFGGMGPGMLPRGLAVMLGLLGAVLAVNAALEGGPRLERWSLRGPLFVLGAVVAFGLAIRGFTLPLPISVGAVPGSLEVPPLGLAVAGPLAIMISAFASKEVRWLETLVFGTLMTAFCIGLFKLALGLPIPLAPWLIGY